MIITILLFVLLFTPSPVAYLYCNHLKQYLQRKSYPLAIQINTHQNDSSVLLNKNITHHFMQKDEQRALMQPT